MSKSRKQISKKQIEQECDAEAKVSQIDNTELIKMQYFTYNFREKYLNLESLFSRFLSNESLDNIPHTDLAKGVWGINSENILQLRSEQSEEKEIENMMVDN